jgi:hypothetical protein
MPFVPVANVALVETRMRYDSQKVENTLYVHNSDGWDGASLDALAADVLAWWTTHYAALTHTSVTLNEVACTDLTTDTGAIGSISGGGATGSAGGEALPSNVSLSVSFRTAQRGRSFRGRNYIVGIATDNTTPPNTANVGYVDQVETAYDAFKTAMDAEGFEWVVVSRFSGVDPDTGDPIPREAGVATPVTHALVVDSTLDSQRRRLPGRGQ